MAKKIRFPLEMADGAQVRSLEDLREHFDLESVASYYKSGKLLTWLRDRYFDDEAAAVEALDEGAPDFQRKLCEAFGVAFAGAEVDLAEVQRRQERLEQLRGITDDGDILAHVDLVAFDQEELADLLDEDEETIYLCGEAFTVPASKRGVTYVGVNSPKVHISGKVPEAAEELGITFSECTVDNLGGAEQEAAEEAGTPDGAACTAASLDEVADRAFYAMADEDGMGVCIETENYIMFIDREIGWECQKLYKHLYDKRTGKEQVVLLKTLAEGEDLAYTLFNWDNMSTEDKRRIIDASDINGALQLLWHGDVEAIDADIAYIALQIDDERIVYAYKLATDERKVIIKYSAEYGLGSKIAVEGGYFAYDDGKKGLCLLNMATGEQRQILANGEKVIRSSFSFSDGRLYFENRDIFLYDPQQKKARQISPANTSPYISTSLCLEVFPFKDIIYWVKSEKDFFIEKSRALYASPLPASPTLETGYSIISMCASVVGCNIVKKYHDGLLIVTGEENLSIYFLKPHEKTPIQIGKSYNDHSSFGICRIGGTVYFKHRYRREQKLFKVSLNSPVEATAFPIRDESGREVDIDGFISKRGINLKNALL